MKIYFYRYNSICEPDVIDSFKRLGLQVDEETIEMYKKDLLPSECSKIVSPKLINGGYTFVFTINYFPWLSEICQVINIVYISLIVDSPVLELYSESLSNPVNRVFLFDRMLYNEFKSYNKGHVFHIQNSLVKYHLSVQHIRKNVLLTVPFFQNMKKDLLTELLMHSLEYMVTTLLKTCSLTRWQTSFFHTFHRTMNFLKNPVSTIKPYLPRNT